MKPRHLLSARFWFHHAVLPALRHLSPEDADAVLGALGRGSLFSPARRDRLGAAVRGARLALGAGWDDAVVTAELAANQARFAARDMLLDEADLDDRIRASGFRDVEEHVHGGRGVILLGSHFGAHITGIHWLRRTGIPLRLLVQRPRHVSPALRRWFDTEESPPQREFFLHTRMGPLDAARTMLLARDALRAGYAIYVNGDVPWEGAGCRPGRLLGRTHRFQSVWADLAALTGAVVVPTFCTHGAAARYALRFDPPFHVRRGGEAAAVTRYLARLEAEIAAHPAEAVAHLTWDAYRPTARAETVPTVRLSAVPHA